ERYSKRPGEAPVESILGQARRVRQGEGLEFARESSWLRGDEFRGGNDPYLQMLQNCWYAGFYVGAGPRLDLNNVLPRCEVVLPVGTSEDGPFPGAEVGSHLQRLLLALTTLKFDVSAEHSMFQDLLKIDILPSLLIRVHETVKVWATELAARVNEYIGF